MPIIAKYSLNGNANDSSGNGYNGTATNVNYASPLISSGQSVLLSGTNSHIVINNALGLTATSNNTLAFTIKSTSASGTQYITDWCTTSGGNRRIVLYSVSGILYIYSSGASGSSTGLNIVNKKLRICLIHTPSTDYVYVNGALLASIAGGSIGIPYNQLGLGTPVDSLFVAQFIGNIDEVISWNEALSIAQVKNEYLFYNGFM